MTLKDYSFMILDSLKQWLVFLFYQNRVIQLNTNDLTINICLLFVNYNKCIIQIMTFIRMYIVIKQFAIHQ